MSTLADTTDAVLKYTDTAQKLGPNTFLMASILLIIAGFTAAYFWWVVRPDRETQRETQKIFADNIARLSVCTSDTKTVVDQNHYGLNTLITDVVKLKEAAKISCEIITKLDDDNICSEEVGRIKGTIT